MMATPRVGSEHSSIFLLHDSMRCDAIADIPWELSRFMPLAVAKNIKTQKSFHTIREQDFIHFNNFHYMVRAKKFLFCISFIRAFTTQRGNSTYRVTDKAMKKMLQS